MAILENIEQIEQNEKLSKTEEKLTKEMKNPINEEPAKKVVDSTNKTLTNLAKKNFDSILKEHGLNIKDFLKKQNINIPDNNIESLKNLNDAEKANIATYIAQIEVGNEIAKLTTSV